jgi:membrane fusion protein, heavy metal efflux system
LKTIIFFFLATVLLWGCGKREAMADQHADPVDAFSVKADLISIAPDSPMLQQLRLESVRTGVVANNEVISPGKIEANPNHVSHIALPVAGRITSVRVNIGDSVAKGEPLLTIESPDADGAMSTYLQSQAAVTQARANVTRAQSDFDRQKGLFEHEAVAMKDVQAAENVLVQAKTAADQSVAALEQARRRLEILGLNPADVKHTVDVAAPISGKVLELNIAPGEYRNDLSASLMTIADLSTVWISADVPESYIRFIRLGESIEASLVAYPDTTFAGRVSRIADTVNPQTRTLKVQAEIVNAQYRLRPEMFGSIHHIGSTVTMPLVRATAVLQINGKSLAFVQLGPGQFRLVEVKVGKPVGDSLPVISGLKASDKVVVDGALLLIGLVRNIT